MVMDRRTTMAPDVFERHLALMSGQVKAQRARSLLEAQQRRDQLAREAAEHVVQWASLADHRPSAAPADRALNSPAPLADLPRLVLPSGPHRLVPLAESRRRRFRDHLNRLISQAVAPPDPPGAPQTSNPLPPHLPDPDPAFSTQLCTLCRGGCCTGGGDEAYLTADTLRRVLRSQPGLRPQALLNAYLDRLATRTAEGSCIQHTAQGCSLPRDWRSDTCNRYRCDGLLAQQARLRQPQPPSAVVVLQRAQDHWRRDRPDLDNRLLGMALVSAQGITPLPLASEPVDRATTGTPATPAPLDGTMQPMPFDRRTRQC